MKFGPTEWANEGFQVACGEVYYHYAQMLASHGLSKVAFAAFLELLELAQRRVDYPKLGLLASELGYQLGADQALMGNLTLAIEIFILLRDHADQFQFVPSADVEAIAESAAALGLTLRQECRRCELSTVVDKLNSILWEQPTGYSIDLAGRAGLALMSSEDDDLGTRDEILAELKMRSSARPEVKEIAFWAGNVAYGIARDAKHERKFVESISDLAEWLEAHSDWPDMSDIIGSAIENEWITNDFRPGRKTAEALFRLWNKSLKAVLERGGDVNSNNELRSIRMDLEAALKAHEHSTWADNLRQRIRKREGIV